MKGGKFPTYLVKTGSILLITSIALILQVANLLYTTFNSQPSPAFSVAIYFVVELLPAYLLYVLFAPVQKKQGDSRSGTEKTRSSTGKKSNVPFNTDYSKSGRSEVSRAAKEDIEMTSAAEYKENAIFDNGNSTVWTDNKADD